MARTYREHWAKFQANPPGHPARRESRKEARMARHPRHGNPDQAEAEALMAQPEASDPGPEPPPGEQPGHSEPPAGPPTPRPEEPHTPERPPHGPPAEPPPTETRPIKGMRTIGIRNGVPPQAA